MLVHYDCPSPLAVQNIARYKSVLDIVTSLGHKVTNEWTPETYREMADSMLDDSDWQILCEKTLANLNRADAVILEASDKGVFGIGYQAAQALQAGKPTLLILRDNAKSSFVAGLQHPLLKRSDPKNRSVDKQIFDFLEGVKC